MHSETKQDTSEYTSLSPTISTSGPSPKSASKSILPSDRFNFSRIFFQIPKKRQKAPRRRKRQRQMKLPRVRRLSRRKRPRPRAALSSYNIYQNNDTKSSFSKNFCRILFLISQNQQVLKLSPLFSEIDPDQSKVRISKSKNQITCVLHKVHICSISTINESIGFFNMLPQISLLNNAGASEYHVEEGGA